MQLANEDEFLLMDLILLIDGITFICTSVEYLSLYSYIIKRINEYKYY